MTVKPLPRVLRKALILGAGTSLLLVGTALLVLPGPALLVLALGLVVLSSEFPWARRLLERLRAGAGAWRSRLRTRLRHS